MNNTWYFPTLKKYAITGHKELLVLGWCHMILFPRTSSWDPQGHWYSLTGSHHRQAFCSPSSRPRLALLRALAAPTWLRGSRPRCSPELPAPFHSEPGWVITLSFQLPPPDHRASFSVQPHREEYVMQNRCEHKKSLTPKSTRRAPYVIQGLTSTAGCNCTHLKKRGKEKPVWSWFTAERAGPWWDLFNTVPKKPQVCGLEEILTFCSFAIMITPFKVMCNNVSNTDIYHVNSFMNILHILTFSIMPVTNVFHEWQLQK